MKRCVFMRSDRRLNLMLPILRFDEGAQSLQRAVPLLGDLVQVPAHLFEPPGLEFPYAFAAGAAAAYEPGVLERTQVFRHRLARDLGALRQARN